MNLQQEHLPRNKPASEREGYGFSFMDFLEDQWLYILGIIIILGIFLYARYSWRKRNEK